MKFGFISTDWGEYPDIIKVFNTLKAQGWDGCEIRFSADWMGLPERMRDILKETGFEIACLTTRDIPPQREIMSGLVRRRIEYAAALGVERVMIFPPKRPPDRGPTMEEHREFADYAEEMSRYAADLGVEVLLHHHTHGSVEGIDEAEIILNFAPSLKLCLDCYHTTINGGDFTKAFPKWQERVSMVHLHDGNGMKLLDLGEGLIPIKEALQTMRRHKYDGWVCAHGGHTDRIAFEKARVCREYIRSQGF